MTKHSDKKLLGKAIKYLAFALPLLFVSPYLFTLSFLNKEKFIFYVLFGLALIAGAAAVWLVFKALRTFMKAIF